ncbi:MAG TPA: J domain-containing protein [Bacteroidota bacterium]|nr:J domain-containing protein [Bacteroidota bacterium]
MAHKDYYKILGVEKTATPEKIKKAYRKLAQQYHPDKTKGDKSAEEKFKDVNEANAVLSDPEKRKKYDRFGEDFARVEEQQAGGQGGFNWGPSGGANRQSRPMSEEEFSELFGGEGLGDMFESVFGARAGGERSRRRARAEQQGRDFQAEGVLSLQEAYRGAVRLLSIHDQTIKVTLKPGIADGQVLRVPGKGGPGVDGGPNGDLYITVRITRDPVFERKGNDLYCTHSVDLYTAVLGGKSRFTALRGTISLDIQPETQNGKVLRLPGLGMPVYGSKTGFGDLYVTVSVTLPEHLSENERSLFKQLQSLRT